MGRVRLNRCESFVPFLASFTRNSCNPYETIRIRSLGHSIFMAKLWKQTEKNIIGGKWDEKRAFMMMIQTMKWQPICCILLLKTQILVNWQFELMGFFQLYHFRIGNKKIHLIFNALLFFMVCKWKASQNRIGKRMPRILVFNFSNGIF